MAAEQRTFVFAVTFIMIFSVLLATIPIGLQGPAEDPDMVTPVNPNLISGFSESETYSSDNFTGLAYDYTLAGRQWRCAGYVAEGGGFALAAKILIFGVLWFGGLEFVNWISPEGVNRGNTLNFAEIASDAEEGTVSYSLQFELEGYSAGTHVIYWDISNYTDPEDSWDNDELYFIHGFGLAETAAVDIGNLLINLLFLQIPEVPLLVNIILVVPIWASIIYIIWFIVKESLPFV